jgi:hypothetical protein
MELGGIHTGLVVDRPASDLAPGDRDEAWQASAFVHGHHQRSTPCAVAPRLHDGAHLDPPDASFGVDVHHQVPHLLDHLVVEPLEPERRQRPRHPGVLREEVAQGALGRTRARSARRAQPRDQRPGRHPEQVLDLDQGVTRRATLGLAASGAPVAQRGGAHRMAALDQPLVQPGKAHAALRQSLRERFREAGERHRRRPPSRSTAESAEVDDDMTTRNGPSHNQWAG